MGHRIAIIADGALQQVGPPQEVYERPANLFVAGFIGTPPMNIIQARVVQRRRRRSRSAFPARACRFPEPLAHAVAAHETSTTVVVGVRPEHLLLADDGIVPATVTVVESLGHERNIVCRLDDGTLVITRQDMDAPPPGVGEHRAPDDRARVPARVRRAQRRADRRAMTAAAAPPTPAPAPVQPPDARHAARLRARAAVAARVRHVHLLPVRQELLARPLPHAAVPEPAAVVGRALAVPRRADLAPLHEQLQGDGRVRAAHGADRHRARPRPRGARAPAPARHHGLPHDLLVDGRDVGRGRVADLADAAEPADRPA